MQSTVQSAAPGSKWTGGAAGAYGTANTNHGEVFGRLAGLDQRLSAQVDQSSQVVDAGRRNLDSVRQWVIDAAASVPPGKNREQMLLPIVQKGLGSAQRDRHQIQWRPWHDRRPDPRDRRRVRRTRRAEVRAKDGRGRRSRRATRERIREGAAGRRPSQRASPGRLLQGVVGERQTSGRATERHRRHRPAPRHHPGGLRRPQRHGEDHRPRRQVVLPDAAGHQW